MPEGSHPPRRIPGRLIPCPNPAPIGDHTPVTADPVERYLPTLERARAEGLALKARVWFHPLAGVDLLAREPVEQARLAAVTLVARVLSRSIWEKDVEMSGRLFADFPAAAPPALDAAHPGSYRVLVAQLDTGPSGCTQCTVQPGRELCGGCGGEGFILVGHGRTQERLPCPRCVGKRTLPCSTCDGTARARRARVRYIDDREDALSYTYLPNLPPPLESTLDELLAPTADLPACLRVEPSLQVSGGPYRGTAVEPSFHGHRHGDPLRRALVAAAGISGQGQILRQDIRTYARPILLLRYKVAGARRDAALVAGQGGVLRGVV